MRAILEVLLSLLAVFGLLSLGWLAFGRLLSPAGGEDKQAVAQRVHDLVIHKNSS